MRRHDAEIAVVDVLVVVVLDLHDLVAGTEGPAEALDADVAGRVQRLLQLDVERARAEAAAVHRTQHLDVADRIEAETLRDALAHDGQHLPHAVFRIRGIDKVESRRFRRGRDRASAPD